MTPAQKRLVSKIEAGCDLIRSFDVWAGYWWWLRPTAEKVSKATAEAMVRDKVLIEGKTERVYSGYHETPFTLAPKGESVELRNALDAILGKSNA